MNVVYVESFLVAANLIIWLSPAALSLRRRTFSLLHPATIIPVLVMTSMLAAMTERWFNWAGRGFSPGLRITTRFYYYDADFYILPLFILAIAGVAFMAGVRIGCGRAVPSGDDRFHLTGKVPFVAGEYSNQLIPVSLLFSIAFMMPFILFGQGHGFFWAGALLYAFNFIPAVVYSQSAFRGTVFMALGLLAVGTRGTKGDFIYYFLPLLVFFQGNLFRGGKKLDPRRIILLSMIGLALVAGTIRMHQERDNWIEGEAGENLAAKIMVREYGFEVFSILTSESGIWGNAFGITPYGSWSVQELKEAVPGFVGLDKLRMGQEVAKSFMPYDYAYLPEAGFYRFFLFPFYYDFGVIGAILGALVVGLVIALAYRLALSKAVRLGVAWPLFIYLPIPVYSELLVNGAFSYALAHIAIAAAAMWLVARVTTLNLFSMNSYAGEFR